MTPNPNLRACPACGHLLSIRARSCPQCGDPLESESTVPVTITPPAPSNAAKEEPVYYQDEKVLVTASRLVVGWTTYVINNLTSVTVGVRSSGGGEGCFAFVGVLAAKFILIALMMLVFRTPGEALGFGIPGVLLAFFAIKASAPRAPEYVIHFRSASGEVQILTSPDKKRADQIAAAIQRAISENG